MTTKEKRMYANIEKWRSLPKSERRSVLRTLNVKQVASSMAMEGEPVSDLWLQKNAR
ncbi:hypothetical protein IJ118_01665 [Candidatus Saccharibacteria bacterium]|nr:hypothetical protein [Candidatus Saccharibacteria bacterium]